MTEEPDDKYEDAVIAYRAGATIRSLADKYGVSDHAMNRLLRRRGCTIRKVFYDRDYGMLTCECGRTVKKKSANQKTCKSEECTKRAKRAYAQAHRDRSSVQRVKGKAKRIPCLCCNRPFTSTGRGNRLCDPCRRANEDRGEYEEYGISKEWAREARG